MNRRTFAGLMAGAAVCSTGKFTTETLADSKPLNIARMLEVTRVPGVAVAGIKEAKPFQSLRRHGARRWTSRNIHHIFPCRFTLKTSLRVCGSKLVKQGRLDLNRPLQDYLDLGLEGNARKITALHVLTHSTGLSNWRFQPNLQARVSF